MKRVLIISPYFPPSNAADMQRVRMSLPYFESFGWQAEVVCVASEYVDINKDSLLLESLPPDVLVHKVKAFPKKITSKIGLGSVALRSLYYYKKKVNDLLKTNTFDLIYFSTTQFPVCILGAYWKKKFGVPYIIDMQDPWYSDYYLSKPKKERPPKYWFSSRIDKWLEPIAIKSADGLISVSEEYLKALISRYPQIKNIPSATITFGASEVDQIITRNNIKKLKPAFVKNSKYSLVYVGRGGSDMKKSLTLLFQSFQKGLHEEFSLFSTFEIHFIGTSYASKGQGIATIRPLAESFGLNQYVFEQTDRIPFYEGLASLAKADGLMVPGSEGKGYTASKLYPYIAANKPLLAIFHPSSSVVNIITDCNAGFIITLEDELQTAYKILTEFLESIRSKRVTKTNWDAFSSYSAKEMTRKQVILFDRINDRIENSATDK